MRVWRDLGKVAVMVAMFGVCFAMLASVIGIRSPWLGLLLMFYFMGLAKVAEPLFMLRVPHGFRAVDPRLVEQRLYCWLGIRGFGTLLRTTPLRYLNSSVYRARGKRNLAELSRNAESAEAIHFWAAVLFTPYIAYIWSRGLIAETVLFLFVQVVFNVYPVLHLRIVRARLSQIEQAASARSHSQRPN
jgi:Glycosyl-4,4'-diaponeurosporenoate acyltransferase